LPEELETKGLKIAIEKLMEELNSLGKTQFKNVISENLGRFDGKIEYEIFSILLEISNNILKHSNATEAIVNLEKIGNILKLNISDNGVGLPENAEKKGMGLPNLKSRVTSLKGKIDFISKNGLTVKIEIPV
jgi:signal transduction histidine kinase